MIAQLKDPLTKKDRFGDGQTKVLLLSCLFLAFLWLWLCPVSFNRAASPLLGAVGLVVRVAVVAPAS